MNSGVRLLLSGDLHIGRSSSRIPSEVRSYDLRAASAWKRLVDQAIENQVRLVCLSGDVVDQDNKFWEAIGPLEEGLQRLAQSGIQIVAVSGNHDHDVLPRLADGFREDQFKLLGRGGSWERMTIKDRDEPILHLDGWSFPTHYVKENPLRSYDFEKDRNVPTLGMVHGDLNAPNSRYAPLELARLQAAPVNGWLLGHTHAPILREGDPWVLYPGSLQALDPGETGPHGPWIVEVMNGTIGIPNLLPSSIVWYDQLDIDLSDTKDEADIDKILRQMLRSKADQIKHEAGPHLLYASLRLRLVGATPVSHRINEIVNRLVDDLSLSVGSTATLVVEKVDIQTTPAIDLKEHAEILNPLGTLAKLLLELETGELSDSHVKLIGETQKNLDEVWNSKHFAQLDESAVTDELAFNYLRTQARELLTQLLTQLP